MMVYIIDVNTIPCEVFLAITSRYINSQLPHQCYYIETHETYTTILQILLEIQPNSGTLVSQLEI